MFEHTVVAVHFSSSYKPLLESLSELREMGAKEFTLVDVLRVDEPKDLSEAHKAEARRRLEQKQEDLQKDGFEVHIEQPVGHPAQELVKVAMGAKADLILLASRGEGLWREFFHGSTVLELVRRTSIPTLIERLDPKDDTPISDLFSHILLATDGSKRAEGAEAHALELAGRGGNRKLTLLQASESDVPADAADRLRELADKARAKGVDVAVRSEEGDADRVISRVAKEEHASLVVLGKRGNAPHKELMLGETAQEICRNVASSVLVVPGSAPVWTR